MRRIEDDPTLNQAAAFVHSMRQRENKRSPEPVADGGGLPPLDVTDEDHARYDAEWESRWDGYPTDAICAQLYCRERQLASSQEALREMTANYNTLLDEVVRLNGVSPEGSSR